MIVVGVRFKPAGKIYYFDPDKIELALDDGVIVETARRGLGSRPAAQTDYSQGYGQGFAPS